MVPPPRADVYRMAGATSGRNGRRLASGRDFGRPGVAAGRPPRLLAPGGARWRPGKAAGGRVRRLAIFCAR